MRVLLLIFAGGGLGSICRYLLSRIILPEHNFPFGTFLVNILACLLLGLISGIILQRPEFPEYLKLFLIVGFCGGFSTFSAFTAQNLQLIKHGFTSLMLLYTFGSVVISLIVCWLGILAGKIIMP